jgi:hypothetical protein
MFLFVVHVLLRVDLRIVFLWSGLGHVKINFTSMLWSRTCGDWLKLLDRKQIYLLWIYIIEQIVLCLLIDQLPRACNHFCLFVNDQPSHKPYHVAVQREDLSFHIHGGGTAAAGGVVAARWTAGKPRPGTFINAGGQALSKCVWAPWTACPLSMPRLPYSDGPKLLFVSESEHFYSFLLHTNRLGSDFDSFFAGHDPIPVLSWLCWSPLVLLLWSWHPLGLLCWYCRCPPKLLPLSNMTCCFTPHPIGRSHLNLGYFPWTAPCIYA